MKIRVDLTRQQLDLLDDDGKVAGTWPISSAANGAGETCGSCQTPRGQHIIRAKIGQGQPLNAVFVGRRPTGEIYDPSLAVQEPERDWILTRILWLSGMEPGFNRLGDRDSMRRYIYIHGTPDEIFEQKPQSHGCIRMRNADVIKLFEMTPVYTPVEIIEA
jgi:hypothetical protein